MGGNPQPSASAILDAWFASPGHLRALTYATSTAAGGAVVTIDGHGGASAAININY